MARAAVPDYVYASKDFGKCPPGHRFNLYFEVWENNWSLDKTHKTDALRQTLSCSAVTGLMTGLRNRQNQLAGALLETNRIVIDVKSTSPFATGLGLEHPVENGFAFLTPYGMPYLAGSGVKGVLRRAAEELCQDGATSFDDTVVNALFGMDSQTAPRRGALTFWDVFPVPAKNSLVVEIMTPHSSHYLQDGKAPHDAGKPNPIPFLAVPAGSEFRFVVTCEPSLIPTEIRADLQTRWKPLLEEIMQHAFDWLGFGAKTSVGYGAMEEDKTAKQKREADAEAIRKKVADEAAQAARAAELEKLSPEQREIGKFLDVRKDRNMPEMAALMGAMKKDNWSGEMKVGVARHLKMLMEKAGKWKEKSEKKNPDKDHDYQDTLRVTKWLGGE